MKNWKNKKILVAEDEMGNYMFISEILEETKIQITHAINGKIALDLCTKEQFDIIFMDIKMPIMNGLEATTEIRKFDKNVVIIAQTAYAYKREECILAGFTDCMSKPFSEQALINMFMQYLGV